MREGLRYREVFNRGIEPGGLPGLQVASGAWTCDRGRGGTAGRVGGQ